MSSSAALPPTPVTIVGQTVIVTLSGPDRPGVSKAIFGGLSRLDLLVIDVEQVVIHGQLILAILVAPGPDSSPDVLHQAVEAAEAVAAALDMRLSHQYGAGGHATQLADRVHVTLLGAPLRPQALTAITARITASGGNIDRIERLAAYPVTALELDVSGADTQRLRVQLTETAAHAGVDIAVQRTGLQRRAKRLVVMDVDSTLIQGEVIEMLATVAGCEAEVRALTQAAMRGEIDFEQSLRERVALLAGTPANAIASVAENVVLAPGARTLVRTLKRLGIQCGIVSGGFSQITDILAADLEIDFAAANTLEIEDGVITGRLSGPVIDRAAKAIALRQFANLAGVSLSQTIAIGDGANDLDMLTAAGLGIAFNAKPTVRKAADTAVNVPYLDAILFLLGITREEVDAADDEPPQRP